MSTETVFIVDAGNTRLKLGVFKGNELLENLAFDYSDVRLLTEYYNKFEPAALFVSSVLKEDKNQWLFEPFTPIYLTNDMKLPYLNEYKSTTLGKDRMANVSFMANQKISNRVAIDIGTCIKFDFLNDKNEYLGGSISPGLRMRYKALNEFTGKLPLLEPDTADYLGHNTNLSIHAGVMEGMRGEINHFISRYEADYKDLTFFVTGGDSKHFEFPSKSNIFAIENLTLLGLFYIYKLNA
ncbi:MAG: type III pantothenate kinase [Bacteroidetes bacterium]|nr:type III pantothenate kinase [Bacteroidota bacterium]